MKKGGLGIRWNFGK